MYIMIQCFFIFSSLPLWGVFRSRIGNSARRAAALDYGSDVGGSELPTSSRLDNPTLSFRCPTNEVAWDRYPSSFSSPRHPALLSSRPCLKRSGKSGEDFAQQQAEPADEAAEVVASDSKDGVGSVPLAEPEIIAAHAVLGLEMADDGFDGGPAA